MAAANSAVDICNLALSHLNEREITNITGAELSNTEQICATWYDTVRRLCLRKHPWNFATKRASLAALSPTPAFGYDFQYELPIDYIRLVSLGDDTYERLREFELEDGKILIDDSGPLLIRYIYDVVSVAKFDATFVDYFAAELALRLAKPITGNNLTAQFVKALLQDAAPTAFAINGQESPVRRIERSRFKSSRRRFGNYSDGRLGSSD